MNAVCLAKKFIEYRHIDTKYNRGKFFAIKNEFDLLIAEYGEEFVEYLLNDTIAWAVEGNNFYSPKFLWYRVNQVKPKFDADKKALEEKMEEEKRLTQSTYKIQDKKSLLKSDMSIFE